LRYFSDKNRQMNGQFLWSSHEKKNQKLKKMSWHWSHSGSIIRWQRVHRPLACFLARARPRNKAQNESEIPREEREREREGDERLWRNALGSQFSALSKSVSKQKLARGKRCHALLLFFSLMLYYYQQEAIGRYTQIQFSLSHDFCLFLVLFRWGISSNTWWVWCVYYCPILGILSVGVFFVWIAVYVCSDLIF